MKGRNNQMEQLQKEFQELNEALQEKVKELDEHIEARDVDSAKETNESIKEIEAKIKDVEAKINELKEDVEQVKDESSNGDSEEDEEETDQGDNSEENGEERSQKGEDEVMENRQILDVEGDNTMETRTAFIRTLQGKADAEERAIVQSSENADGGYVVPEDLATDINELKRNYKSAKELVDVVTTGTDKGNFVMEEGANVTQLVNFDEDNDGLDEQAPKFKNIAYQIANYGAITPISNSFLQDEQGNFLQYLNRLFARKAIRTENAKIFKALTDGKTAEKVANIEDVKAQLHSLDPAIADNAVIVVNQTAFTRLDAMTDENGRGLLQPNPADATKMTLLGRPVHVFSDAELDGDAMFIGDLNEGVKFFDRGVYEVAISSEAGFTRNQ